MGAHEVLGIYSASQVITAAAASTNTVNFQQTTPKIGVGSHAPYLCIRSAVAPTDTADTLSIEFQTDADDGAGAPAGVWGGMDFMPLAGAAGAEIAGTDARLLTAGGWIWRCKLHYNISAQHTRLYYNNTTSNGQFTIDAWLSDGPASDFRGSQVIKSNVGQP